MGRQKETMRIPGWVEQRVKRIDMHDLSHLCAEENKCIVIHGRHYKYRVTASGQGGPIVRIERKLRKK